MSALSLAAVLAQFLIGIQCGRQQNRLLMLISPPTCGKRVRRSMSALSSTSLYCDDRVMATPINAALALSVVVLVSGGLKRAPPQCPPEILASGLAAKTLLMEGLLDRAQISPAARSDAAGAAGQENHAYQKQSESSNDAYRVRAWRFLNKPSARFSSRADSKLSALRTIQAAVVF